ncbi:MAG TPA: cutinase family protein, partial [Mycobacterium sp.]|nr:cutinase family protein [Mycobacterium sp.]
MSPDVNAYRIVTAAAVLAAGAALPATPLLAPAAAESCPNAEVVFARGTNEPPGIGRIGNAFVSALRSTVPGKSVGAYAVNYPASYNFLTAADGANDASGHVQYMAENCPDTRLVLGGYSQGAAVIDILTAAPIAGFGFSEPLPPAAADHVAAVALFGNPSKRLGNVWTAVNPQFAAKTVDLCDGSDPVCSDGRDWAAHTQYVQAGLAGQAAAFVAARL